MIVLFIVMIIIAFFTYLIILGASKCNSEKELKREDKIQSYNKWRQ